MIGLNYFVHNLAKAIIITKNSFDFDSQFFIKFENLEIFDINNEGKLLYSKYKTNYFKSNLPDNFLNDFSELRQSKWRGMVVQFEDKDKKYLGTSGSFITYIGATHVRLCWFTNNISTLVHELNHFFQELDILKSVDSKYKTKNTHYCKSQEHNILNDFKDVFDKTYTKTYNNLFDMYFRAIHDVYYRLTNSEISSVSAQTVVELLEHCKDNNISYCENKKIKEYFFKKSTFSHINNTINEVYGDIEYIRSITTFQGLNKGIVLDKELIIEFVSRYRYINNLAKKYGKKFKQDKVKYITSESYYKNWWRKFRKNKNWRTIRTYKLYSYEESVKFLDFIEYDIKRKHKKLLIKCSKPLTNLELY